MRVFYSAIVIVLLYLPSLAAADDPLRYRVGYDLAAPSVVHVSLNLAPAASAPLTLIMPRTVPGGYAQQPYDPFVTNVKAYAAADTSLEVRRDELGPRWKIGKNGQQVTRVEYDVD